MHDPLAALQVENRRLRDMIQTLILTVLDLNRQIGKLQRTAAAAELLLLGIPESPGALPPPSPPSQSAPRPRPSQTAACHARDPQAAAPDPG